ncbi:hypothetical protein MP228_004548 [Amoeboaphelidium protococcarum]|nr:hypothetical protein MP228_004548 [Amoeboaphelidium protococcarum]
MQNRKDLQVVQRKFLTPNKRKTFEQDENLNSSQCNRAASLPSSPCLRVNIKPLDMSDWIKATSAGSSRLNQQLFSSQSSQDQTEDKVITSAVCTPSAVDEFTDSPVKPLLKQLKTFEKLPSVNGNFMLSAVDPGKDGKVVKSTSVQSNPQFKPVIRNGKVAFMVEKKLQLDQLPECIQQLAEFYQYLSNQKEPITSLKDDQLPLIAVLVEESELTLPALSKNLVKKLNPSALCDASGKQILTAETIMAAISKVAVRKDYSIPGCLNKLKWESVDLKLFSASVASQLESRRLSRTLYTEQLQSYWNSLTDEQKLQQSSATAGKKSRIKSIPQSEPDFKVLASQPDKCNDLVPVSECGSPSEVTKTPSAKQSKANLKKAATTASKKSAASGSSKVHDKSQKRISGFFMKKADVSVSTSASSAVAKKSEKTFDDYFPAVNTRSHVSIYQRNFAIKPSLDVIKKVQEDVLQCEFYQNVVHKRSKLTKPKTLGSVPVEIVSLVPNAKVQLRQFHDNFRPAFYGNGNKSNVFQINRRPFKLISQIDYDYDSDEEWAANEDEQEEGEDLVSDDDNNDDAESVEEGDEDGWLVPEGYLSEDERVDEGEDDTDAVRQSANSSPKSGHNKTKRVLTIIPEIYPVFIVKDSIAADLSPPLFQTLKVLPLLDLKFPLSLSPPPVAVATGDEKKVPELNAVAKPKKRTSNAKQKGDEGAVEGGVTKKRKKAISNVPITVKEIPATEATCQIQLPQQQQQQQLQQQ